MCYKIRRFKRTWQYNGCRNIEEVLIRHAILYMFHFIKNQELSESGDVGITYLLCKNSSLKSPKNFQGLHVCGKNGFAIIANYFISDTNCRKLSFSKIFSSIIDLFLRVFTSQSQISGMKLKI